MTDPFAHIDLEVLRLGLSCMRFKRQEEEKQRDMWKSAASICDAPQSTAALGQMQAHMAFIAALDIAILRMEKCIKAEEVQRAQESIDNFRQAATVRPVKDGEGWT